MTPLCPSGKTDHPDRASANAQLVSLKAAKQGRNMHAYHCTKCGRWHIGHIPGIRRGIETRKREKG
jgi:hypothetical protein